MDYLSFAKNLRDCNCRGLIWIYSVTISQLSFTELGKMFGVARETVRREYYDAIKQLQDCMNIGQPHTQSDSSLDTGSGASLPIKDSLDESGNSISADLGTGRDINIAKGTECPASVPTSSSKGKVVN